MVAGPEEYAAIDVFHESFEVPAVLKPQCAGVEGLLVAKPYGLAVNLQRHRLRATLRKASVRLLRLS